MLPEASSSTQVVEGFPEEDELASQPAVFVDTLGSLELPRLKAFVRQA